MQHKRVMLKLSGEALAGESKVGINPAIVSQYASQIKSVYDEGFEICVVVGGGNIWRGTRAETIGIDRASADYMGMLGTVINALALSNALSAKGVPSRVMTSMSIPSVAEPYLRKKALSHIAKGRVLVFGGGTGNPYFTTDTTVALRAAEMNATLILMAKNGVDAVYNKDPRQHKDAKKISKLTYHDLINQELKIIDLTAAAMCSENNIQMIIFDVNGKNGILNAVKGVDIGTTISV